MKVLFVDHTARRSGAEIKLSRVTAGLACRTDVEVEVLLAERGPLLDVLADAGVSTSVMNVPRVDVVRWPNQLRVLGHLLNIMLYACYLRREIRYRQSDVVCSYSIQSNVACFLARVGLRAVQCWHVNDQYSTEYFSRFSVIVLRAMARKSAGIVSNSWFTRSFVNAGYVSYPPLPLGWPADAPKWRGVESGGLRRIGMVGRIARWKGQDVFLNAFAAHFAGDLRYEALIVGGALFGEQDYEDELVKMCVELGIADQVRFVGHVDDPHSIMAELAAVVHASRIAEPFGQVVTESLSIGVPLIASDAGGPREVITHLTDGLLTRPDSVDELGNALTLVCENPELAGRLSINGMILAEKFQADAIVDSYLAYLRSVVKRRSAGGNFLA